MEKKNHMMIASITSIGTLKWVFETIGKMISEAVDKAYLQLEMKQGGSKNIPHEEKTLLFETIVWQLLSHVAARSKSPTMRQEALKKLEDIQIPDEMIESLENILYIDIKSEVDRNEKMIERLKNSFNLSNPV